MRYLLSSLIIIILLQPSNIFSEEKKEDKKIEPMSAGTFSGLKFRALGPGLASGRIIDFAVCEEEPNYFFAAVASGGVWKTTTGGIDWTPVFDKQGSYSIGCVSMDPNNRHVIWVGTGENNSQRSVSYGDGIYKSCDAGKTWKHVGLKNSEHIGKILIDPRNSNVVYVAAQGPLWGPGGDRGLYKTSNGGENWELVLEISENTGVSDIAFDPRDPDLIYASSYQRRRHVWTLINGGPESALYKSTDAGKTWNKLTNGIPGGELGRIGIAVSPANPDIVFALIEAHGDKGGFFRSTDRGASWKKVNPYKSVSAQYYQEIFCDPIDPDKVYIIDTFTKYSLDGGKTWKRLGLKERHVDDHALWIDPDDTDHLLIGGDGGVYETYNMGETWRFFENLPVTQFYRIGVDNTEPFYYVYGGTQDNATIGGPVRTVNANGIMNQDFYFTKGGDGFQSRIDPKNPDIVYSQAQYGSLVRFDRKSGERTDIQPQPEKDEALRWNWDSPLIISPHSNTRLYFAANVLFRSDDRGNSWTKVSGDLTRQIDRNQLKVMGKIWPPEAVAKNASTSLYGNIVSLDESPLQENLLYVGTDDGLIQVSEDAKTWVKYDKFIGVPGTTYVSDLLASMHDPNTVYACFDNHKMADFKPYILKSTDKGKTWKSISGDLPENGPVYCVLEDHEKPDLLFAGTEYGFFFTVDGGKKWVQLKGGIPTIAIKDAEIQRRENDLALASFGRGFYIMDDYSPLRQVDKEMLEKQAHIFPVKDALMYIQDKSFGRRAMGENFFRAENPFGATFTYYLKEAFKTKKAKRKEEAKKISEKGQTPPYPSFGELKQEDLEEAPYLLFTISDAAGNPVRKLKAPNKAGVNRITWDMKYPDLSPPGEKTKINKASGYPAIPGEYSVTMSKVIDGRAEQIAGPVKFTCKVLENTTLPPKDRPALAAFQDEVMSLVRTAYGAENYLKALEKKVAIMKKALLLEPKATAAMKAKARDIELQLAELKETLYGDAARSSRNASYPPGVLNRLGRMAWYMWGNSSAPTETNRETVKIVREEMAAMLAKMKNIAEKAIHALEAQMDSIGAPWTPGRFPKMD